MKMIRRSKLVFINTGYQVHDLLPLTSEDPFVSTIVSDELDYFTV